MNLVFLDDEDFLFPLMQRYFKILSISSFLCTTSPDEASIYISNNKCDYLIIDYNMPDVPDINKYVKSLNNDMNIVIVSGDDNNYIESNINFKYIFLKKPFILEDLKKILSIQ